MEVDRIYLDSELTVEKLAAIMHIPRKQLSQVLNEQFKQNFNSFINTYRIIEAQKLILDPRYRKNKLLVVALDAGLTQNRSLIKLSRSMLVVPLPNSCGWNRKRNHKINNLKSILVRKKLSLAISFLMSSPRL